MTIDRTTPLCLIWAVGGVISLFMSFGQSGLRAKLLHTHSAVSLAIAVFYCLGYEDKQETAPTAPTAPYSPQLPSSPDSPKLFVWRSHDWQNFSASPHFAIVGGTGDGKSTTTKYLTTLLTGYKLAIDPHQAADTWHPIKPVGQGGCYGEIAIYMQALIKLMRQRYKLRTSDKQVFEPITVILDEYPAIAASSKCKDIAREFLRVMLFEARKVQIRLVLQTQSDRVEALGIKGLGDIRDSLTFIRLGKKAIDYAKSTKDSELISGLSRQARPCMFADAIAPLPNLSNVAAKCNAAMPSDLQAILQGSNEVPDEFLVGSNQGSSSGSSSRTYEVPEVPESEPSEYADPLLEVLEPETVVKIITLRRGGLPQDEIIKAVFGVAKGGSKKYLSARGHYLQVIQNAGLD